VHAAQDLGHYDVVVEGKERQLQSSQEQAAIPPKGTKGGSKDNGGRDFHDSDAGDDSSKGYDDQYPAGDQDGQGRYFDPNKVLLSLVEH